MRSRGEWKELFIKWVVIINQSLRQVVAESDNQLLLYRNPVMEEAVPYGPATVHNYIVQQFEALRSFSARSIMANSEFHRVSLSQMRR